MQHIAPRPVIIHCKEHQLPADILEPAHPTGIVILVHGSGTSRNSSHNLLLGHELGKVGLATLLVDLLDEYEIHDRHNVFDVELLAERLIETVRWVRAQPQLGGLPIGLCGHGIGATTVVLAAAREPSGVSAVVASAGRPDVVQFWLPRVQAPTLLIVGAWDSSALAGNQLAFEMLESAKQLVIVPHAGHLFEEPGTIGMAARHARRWLAHYLSMVQGPAAVANGRCHSGERHAGR